MMKKLFCVALQASFLCGAANPNAKLLVYKAQNSQIIKPSIQPVKLKMSFFVPNTNSTAGQALLWHQEQVQFSRLDSNSFDAISALFIGAWLDLMAKRNSPAGYSPNPAYHNLYLTHPAFCEGCLYDWSRPIGSIADLQLAKKTGISICTQEQMKDKVADYESHCRKMHISAHIVRSKNEVRPQVQSSKAPCRD